MFPPISPQEANEKTRVYQMKKDHSRQQMAVIPPEQMRTLTKSPSSKIKAKILSQPPLAKRQRELAERTTTHLYGRIERQFDKLVGVTTDGNKLGFYMHNTALSPA